MITKFTNGLVLNKDFEIVKTDVYVDGSRIAAIGKHIQSERQSPYAFF